jgi:hypothetical protein
VAEASGDVWVFVLVTDGTRWTRRLDASAGAADRHSVRLLPGRGANGRPGTVPPVAFVAGMLAFGLVLGIAGGPSFPRGLTGWRLFGARQRPYKAR